MCATAQFQDYYVMQMDFNNKTHMYKHIIPTHALLVYVRTDLISNSSAGGINNKSMPVLCLHSKHTIWIMKSYNSIGKYLENFEGSSVHVFSLWTRIL